MDAATERQLVAEVERLRNDIRAWRWIAMVLAIAMVVWCIWRLSQSVRSLTQEGPEQQQFFQELNRNVQKDIVPQVRTVAAETLTEVQPILRTSVDKLGKRVPEITQVAEQQLSVLQTDLPQRGEAAFDKTLNGLLTERQDKIRSLYGSATDQQLRSLVLSLQTVGQQSLQEVNREIFYSHQQKLNDILQQLQAIKTQEAPHVKGDEPTWEMGVLLLDIFRNDIKSIADAASSKTPGVTTTDKSKVKAPEPTEKSGKSI